MSPPGRSYRPASDNVLLALDLTVAANYPGPQPVGRREGGVRTPARHGVQVVEELCGWRLSGSGRGPGTAPRTAADRAKSAGKLQETRYLAVTSGWRLRGEG